MIETEAANKESVRIFIGSSARNLIEEKVFCYTLKKYSCSPLDIYIIDGQKGTAKRLLTNEIKTLPPEVIGNIPGATAFSLARWAIPQWCDYQGKAIYCDSDQLALADITALWNSDLDGFFCGAVPVSQAKCRRRYMKKVLNFLAVEDQHYLASVMLFDCEKASDWSLEGLIEQLNQKQFSITDLMFLSSPLRKHFGIDVKTLPAEWNHLDILEPNSKIVHFTDLTSQPWKFHHHPLSNLWEQNFLEALDHNALTLEDISVTRDAGHISERVKSLPSMPSPLRSPINRIWQTSIATIFLTVQFLNDCRETLLSTGKRAGSKVKRLVKAYS